MVKVIKNVTITEPRQTNPRYKKHRIRHRIAFVISYGNYVEVLLRLVFVCLTSDKRNLRQTNTLHDNP